MRFEYQVPSLAGLDDEQDDLCANEDYARDGLRGLGDAAALSAAKAKKQAALLRSVTSMPGMPSLPRVVLPDTPPCADALADPLESLAGDLGCRCRFGRCFADAKEEGLRARRTPC